jgi:branched-chain amino acid transport system ATP-binding protein
MNMPLLKVSDVSIAYGKVEAVRNVALTIGAREIVTVIGANGAGKSTLLNAIMGILPSRGGIVFDGNSITHSDIEERFTAGLSLVPERRELFTTMSVEDNLRLGAFRQSRTAAAQGLAEMFARFPRLGERSTQLAGTLSGGEQQMLAIGRALMGRPKLLMLDEPSLGLAPRIVADIFTILRTLRESGVSILLVEQNARAALKLADRAYVMETGSFVLDGSADEIASDARVMESYLGHGTAAGN